jgi:hypothetical protein
MIVGIAKKRGFCSATLKVINKQFSLCFAPRRFEICGYKSAAAVTTQVRHQRREGSRRRDHLANRILISDFYHYLARFAARRHPRLSVDHALDCAIILRKKKAQSDQRPVSPDYSWSEPRMQPVSTMISARGPRPQDRVLHPHRP